MSENNNDMLWRKPCETDKQYLDRMHYNERMREYNGTHRYFFTMSLNRKKEFEMINWLENVPSNFAQTRIDYIKMLIYLDMEKHKNNDK